MIEIDGNTDITAIIGAGSKSIDFDRAYNYPFCNENEPLQVLGLLPANAESAIRSDYSLPSSSRDNGVPQSSSSKTSKK